MIVYRASLVFSSHQQEMYMYVSAKRDGSGGNGVVGLNNFSASPRRNSALHYQQPRHQNGALSPRRKGSGVPVYQQEMKSRSASLGDVFSHESTRSSLRTGRRHSNVDRYGHSTYNSYGSRALLVDGSARKNSVFMASYDDIPL